MDYRHSQSGYLALLVLVLLAIVGGLVTTFASSEESAAAFGIMGLTFLVVLVVVFWFSRLTVTIDGGQFRAHFGPGWPRRKVETRTMIGFRKVRNKWYYGWGIRRLPEGWMYNVWGLDAVEIELMDGTKFRIGTNESDELLAALSANTALRPG